MKLNTINIENYKSIKSLLLNTVEVNKSKTYSLLGINESGKSSILKAISLFDSEDVNFPEDFFNDLNPIRITFNYELDDYSKKVLQKELISTHKFDKHLIDKLHIQAIDIVITFENIDSSTKKIEEIIYFENELFEKYTSNNEIVEIKEIEESPSLDLNLFFKANLKNYFYSFTHTVILWKATPEYLLLDEIDLLEFSKNPKEISIPLLNCFNLSNINKNELEEEIAKLKTPARINSLQNKLSEITTKHINNVWPEHPISVQFQISNNKISLLIEDNNVKFQPKTTGQRSDGFKQFISFLLTISVENFNKTLSNTILLIDEPEIHLHPPAQINLLKELIKITSNDNNNILIFATHSNYLIDKNNLDRNFKVTKRKNLESQIERIEKKKSTYAEVNYEVFNILTNDYHNELYGFIEAENKDLLEKLDKIKNWKNAKTQKNRNVSLSEYIRHSIHHPENELNKIFSDNELLKSIKTLRNIKESI